MNLILIECDSLCVSMVRRRVGDIHFNSKLQLWLQIVLMTFFVCVYMRTCVLCFSLPLQVVQAQHLISCTESAGQDQPVLRCAALSQRV